MTAYYRTSFTIKGSSEKEGIKLLNEVSNAVYEWARDKEPVIDGKIGQWRREEGKPMVRLYGDTSEESGKGYYALTLERSEEHDGLIRPGVQANSIWWALELQMATDGNDVSVTAEDQCINGLQPLDDMDWPPPVVAKLFDNFSCYLGQTLICSGAERVVGQKQATHFVQNEVFGKERLLPIIVVRDNINNVSTDAIQAYFRGQATVVTYAEDAAWDVNVGLGRLLACRPGAVRIYWPNCTANDEPQDHRQFEPRNVVERLGDRLQLVLRDEFVSYFPSEGASILFNKARETFNDVSSQVRRENLQVRHSQLRETQDVNIILSEFAEREEGLIQENKRLEGYIEQQRRQIQELTAENSQLKAEIEQLTFAREYEEGLTEPSTADATDSTPERRVVIYKSRGGNRESRFENWRNKLDADTKENISAVVERMREGNLGDVKALGGGLKERRINYGPGYRIYFTEDNNGTIVLFGGGDKDSQDDDIQTMHRLLMLHKRQTGARV